MNTIPLATLKISARIILKPGDHFRVGRGPRQAGRRVGLRGEFRFLRAFRRGAGVYVEAIRLDSSGLSRGQFTLYVSGPEYDHRGLRMVPYTLRRIRKPARQRVTL